VRRAPCPARYPLSAPLTKFLHADLAAVLRTLGLEHPRIAFVQP